MKTNLTSEGVVALVSGVLGIVALLVLFGCASGSTVSCDNLLAEEKDRCIRQIDDRDRMLKFQMETNGTVR